VQEIIHNQGDYGMGFLDSIRSFSEYIMEGERDNDLDFDDTPTKQAPTYRKANNYTRSNANGYSGSNSSNGSSSNGANHSKVIDLPVTTNVKMSTFRPISYNSNGECREIAAALAEKRCVILNLEDMEKKDQRRLLDFLAGFSYAQDNVFQRITMDVYFFGPYNVDFIGGDELMSFLEESNPW
jgi:FtsZ-interacting cell division protein YlmF